MKININYFLLAILSVTALSCNKDDDDATGPATPNCFVSSVVSGADSTNASYISEQLDELSRFHNGALVSTKSYTYSANIIVDEWDTNGLETGKTINVLMNLNGQFIIIKQSSSRNENGKQFGDTTWYYYNLEGYMTRSQTRHVVFEDGSKTSDYRDSVRYVRENGNITQRIFKGAVTDTVRFEYYTDKLNTLFNNFGDIHYGFNYYGYNSLNLLKKVTHSANGDVYEYEYTFDENQNIKSYTRKNIQNGTQQVFNLNYMCL